MDSFSLKAHQNIQAADALTTQSARKNTPVELQASPKSDGKGSGGRGRTPNTYPRVTSQSCRDMTEIRKVLFDDVDQGALQTNGNEVVTEIDTDDHIAVADPVDEKYSEETMAAARMRLDEMEEQLAMLKRLKMENLEREHKLLLSAPHDSKMFGKSPSPQVSEITSPRLSSNGSDKVSPRTQATVVRESPRAFSSRTKDFSSEAISQRGRGHVSSLVGDSPTEGSPRSQRVASNALLKIDVAGKDAGRAGQTEAFAKESKNMDAEAIITHEIFNYLMQQGTPIEEITEADIRGAITKVLSGGRLGDDQSRSRDNMSLITHADQESAGIPENLKSLLDTPRADQSGNRTNREADDSRVIEEEEVRVLQEELRDLQDQMSEMRSIADSLGISLPDYPSMENTQTFGTLDAEIGSDTDEEIGDYSAGEDIEIDGIPTSEKDDVPEAGMYVQDLDNDKEALGGKKGLSQQQLRKAELQGERAREISISDEDRLRKLVGDLDADVTKAEARVHERETSPRDANRGSGAMSKGIEATTTDDIYKEVSMFIVQHESRPGFVLNLFRALQGMTSDYECERLIAATDDIKRFVAIHPELKGTASPPQSANPNASPTSKRSQVQQQRPQRQRKPQPQQKQSALVQRAQFSSAPTGMADGQVMSKRVASVNSKTSGTPSQLLASKQGEGTTHNNDEKMNSDLQRALELIHLYPGSGVDAAANTKSRVDVNQKDLLELIGLNNRMQERVERLKDSENVSNTEFERISDMVRQFSLADKKAPPPADVAGVN